MSQRYLQARSLVVLFACASMSMAFSPLQAPQQVPSAPPVGAAPAAPAPVAAGMKYIGVPAPEKGKLYRFSLCTGQLLDGATVSRPCYPDAAKGVSGAAPNHLIEFRLENGQFLPPGFTLDGNGVITGAANADPSKLKAVRICAIQQGALDTNYLCKGQSVDFKGLKTKAPSPAPAAKSGGSGVGTAVIVGLGIGGAVAAVAIAKSALDDLNTNVDTAGTPTTGSTSPSSANFVYGNFNCGSSSQCATVFGGRFTGSVGPICSLSVCDAWRASHGSGTTCTSTPQFTVVSGPASGCTNSPQ